MKAIKFFFCAVLVLTVVSCEVTTAEMPEFSSTDHVSLFYIDNQTDSDWSIDVWYTRDSDSLLRTVEPHFAGKSMLICEHIDANGDVPELVYPNWHAHSWGTNFPFYHLQFMQIRRNINNNTQYERYLIDIEKPSGFLLPENYELRPDYKCSYDLYVIRQYKKRLPASQIHHYVFTIDEKYLSTLPCDTVDYEP